MIEVGSLLSTFGAGLQSLTGAPRLLQSIAKVMMLIVAMLILVMVIILNIILIISNISNINEILILITSRPGSPGSST